MEPKISFLICSDEYTDETTDSIYEARNAFFRGDLVQEVCEYELDVVAGTLYLKSKIIIQSDKYFSHLNKKQHDL